MGGEPRRMKQTGPRQPATNGFTLFMGIKYNSWILSDAMERAQCRSLRWAGPRGPSSGWGVFSRLAEGRISPYVYCSFFFFVLDIQEFDKALQHNHLIISILPHKIIISSLKMLNMSLL